MEWVTKIIEKHECRNVQRQLFPIFNIYVLHNRKSSGLFSEGCNTYASGNNYNLSFIRIQRKPAELPECHISGKFPGITKMSSAEQSEYYQRANPWRSQLSQWGTVSCSSFRGAEHFSPNGLPFASIMPINPQIGKGWWTEPSQGVIRALCDFLLLPSSSVYITLRKVSLPFPSFVISQPLDSSQHWVCS